MRAEAVTGEPMSSSAKNNLRAEMRAQRRAHRADPEGDARRLARAISACRDAEVVAAYASSRVEPDTWALLDWLVQHQIRVLLPTLNAGPSRPDWGWYTDRHHLVAGPLGIRQPAGPGLGPDALTQAQMIWLPGMAGTPSGDRLGTGGGWYDRALLHADDNAVRGLLLFDAEVVSELPVDAWDQPVDLVVTEARRIDCPPRRPLGNTKGQIRG